MSFFDSEVVRAEMVEIQELQEEVYKNVFSFPSMDNDEKLIHIDLLEKLIDKQKILYTRLSLSDDPDAKMMKDQIVESATMMGLPRGTDMSVVFNNMSSMIDVMKKQIDDNDFDMQNMKVHTSQIQLILGNPNVLFRSQKAILSWFSDSKTGQRS